MFLAAEPLIVARLIEACPSARAVLTTRDLGGVQESSQVAPALHVCHDGWAIDEVIGMGDTSRVVEHWLVVAVVRHARQGRDAAAALREEAAPLVAEAMPPRPAGGPRPIWAGCARSIRRGPRLPRATGISRWRFVPVSPCPPP